MLRLALPLFLALFSSSSLSGQSPARTGKDYAVFFYVTGFQTGLQALPETKTEALALKTELEQSYGFQCELVANPTKQQILDKLAAWNQRLGPDDQILYYFAMHGHYDPASDLGYLIAADGQVRDPYFNSYLNYNSLRPYFALDKCRARHVLVALDACHSGSFGTRLRGRPDGPDYAAAPDCDSRIRAAFSYAGRQFVCSGNKNTKTPAQSPFAARFLEALRSGADRHGLLAFDDLAYWLGKVKNPEPENGAFTGHDPGGDFLFVRKNACTSIAGADRDGDGIPDAEDACPQEYGTAEARGCPDADGDGVPDHSDRCKYAAGLARWQGCPDSDGDGVPDHEDKCPNEKGEPALEGCPRPDNVVFIRGGTFQMGSDEGETDEKPVHTVTVSDFYLGKYEVTVAEFRAFVEAVGYQTDAEKAGTSRAFEDGKWVDKAGRTWRHDPEGNPAPDNHPVINVSWNDAIEYCRWLSQKTGRSYRLPTEAEWEYAAGNGSRHTKYSWGNDNPSGKNGGNVADESKRPGDNATWSSKFDGYNDGYWYTAPVGSYAPNDFGLYDMTGNVWEWCADWYASDYYKNSPAANPIGPASGSSRVFRGGSWFNGPQDCRVAFRYGDSPGFRGGSVGFRLARTF